MPVCLESFRGDYFSVVQGGVRERRISSNQPIYAIVRMICNHCRLSRSVSVLGDPRRSVQCDRPETICSELETLKLIKP